MPQAIIWTNDGQFTDPLVRNELTFLLNRDLLYEDSMMILQAFIRWQHSFYLKTMMALV